LQEALPTRCFAIDTWRGDEHAGFYAEDIFTDFKHFHDAHYAGFSRMLRCTFDEALPRFADGSIDLLHIDGRHGYGDVRHDFYSWLPKLSPRAVVLFHDTNERTRDFGVWRLWAELREAHPGFEFTHAHGLGVLMVGSAEPPPAIVALCGLSETNAAMLRERFAMLGEPWQLTAQLQAQQRKIAALEQRMRVLQERHEEDQTVIRHLQTRT
jgi:hypothetical protein